jgi:hypothetical protein
MTPIQATRPAPSAFLSYACENDTHRAWVREFATRLRTDGVDVTLDQWAVHPGDQLPAFMERAVRENDYVLVICTPAYATRSNPRQGGVGYEGDIITAEVFTMQNRRKFIPIFRAGHQWTEAAPIWLQGSYRIDLRNDPYSEEQYNDLLTTLHGLRPTAPPLGPGPVAAPPIPPRPTAQPRTAPPHDEGTIPIRIIGIVVDEITTPRNDGTPGSALYRIPFQLSQRPAPLWAGRFIEHWNHPSRFTTMHRPGIGHISGDRFYLDGTTIEEVERYHRDTLKLAIQETNEEIMALEQAQRAAAARAREQEEAHERAVREAARRINFD